MISATAATGTTTATAILPPADKPLDFRVFVLLFDKAAAPEEVDDACDVVDLEVVTGVGVTATGAVEVTTMVVGGKGVPLLEGVATTREVSWIKVVEGVGAGVEEVGVGVGVVGVGRIDDDVVKKLEIACGVDVGI